MNELFPKMWAMSALSYDEAGMPGHVADLIPKWKYHFIKSPHGAHYFGLLLSPDTKTAIIVNRGTDGDDLAGKVVSWANDLNFKTGDNDIVDGFEGLGNIVFNEFKEILYETNIVGICGHSQGAATAQYESKLCFENLSSDKLIVCHSFATPPWCREKTSALMQNHQATNRLIITQHSHKRDPVCAEAIYRFTRTSRIGYNNILPCPLDYEVGPVDAAYHSCRLYNASILIYGINNNLFTPEDIVMLGEVHKRCVN
jgi:hypothetical protein